MRFFTILLLSVVFVSAKAQQNLTFYHLGSVHQANYVNPAFFPTTKVCVGLPVISSLYIGVSNSGFSYKDVFTKGADDSIRLNMDNIISKLAKNNYLNSSLQPDLFSFGIKIKKNYINFNVTEKINVSFRYPKDFIEFAWKGNGAFLGEEKNFNFGVNASHYREYGIGFAREISDKLIVGGKLKYLYGMENISTQKSDLKLYTSPNNFDITASSDIEINTAGLDSATLNNFSANGDYFFKRKNKGVGLDLGGIYKLNDKITLSASLIDMGYIKWNTGVVNHVSKNPGSSFTFHGLDFNQFFGDSTKNTDSTFTHLADSVADQFSIVKTYNSYTTALPSQFYIGGSYQVVNFFRAGALINGYIHDKSMQLGITLSANVKVGKWLATSLSYSIVNRSYTNLGFGLVATAGAQFYIVSDNIMAIMAPQGAKNFNLRFGFNIAIGKGKKDKDSPSY